MVCFFHTQNSENRQKFLAVALALFFVSGLILGAFIAAISEPFTYSLMHTAYVSSVSVIGLICATCLPLLLSAFAVYCHYDRLLLVIAFLKAFCFSYLCSGLMIVYQSAGWLRILLFMFSDCLSVPVYCWLWLRLCNDEGNRYSSLIAAFCIVTSVIFLDYQFISPFLVSILT